MTWISENPSVAITVVVTVGGIVWRFAALEIKMKELRMRLDTCQKSKVGTGDVRETVHVLGDKIQGTLTKIIERLARVETKVDRLNGEPK